jgi:hypothetical protein
VENRPIYSITNLDTRETVSACAKEKKRKETIAEVSREDDCSSLHKFTLSDLQRTLRDLRFVAYQQRVYEILVGRPVFTSDDPDFTIMNRVVQGKMPVIPDRVGTVMQSLITRCWSMNPEERPSFSDIIIKLIPSVSVFVPDASFSVIFEYVMSIQGWAIGQFNSDSSSESSELQMILTCGRF